MISSIKTAKWNYYKIDQFFDSLCSKKINIDLEYESDYVTNQPKICIFLNGVEVYSELCTAQGHISLALDANDKENELRLTMTGKLPGDTIVEDGIIVKDTYLKFSKLHINNYSMLVDYDFFYEKFIHVNEDASFAKAMMGLWSNSSLMLRFHMPFDIWYNSISKKNCAVSDTLRHQDAENIDHLINTLEQSVTKLK
jgi:hypothetical protein